MGLLTKLAIVIDTNVFVSGLIWGGKPREVIANWLKDKFHLLLSPYLASEIVSTFAKFDNPKEEVEKLNLSLETKTIKIMPSKRTHICRDEKDNQILDLCLAGKADFLITGDKDLLALKEFEKTKIVKPKEFLKFLRN